MTFTKNIMSAKTGATQNFFIRCRLNNHIAKPSGAGTFTRSFSYRKRAQNCHYTGRKHRPERIHGEIAAARPLRETPCEHRHKSDCICNGEVRKRQATCRAAARLVGEFPKPPEHRERVQSRLRYSPMPHRKKRNFVTARKRVPPSGKHREHRDGKAARRDAQAVGRRITVKCLRGVSASALYAVRRSRHGSAEPRSYQTASAAIQNESRRVRWVLSAAIFRQNAPSGPFLFSVHIVELSGGRGAKLFQYGDADRSCGEIATGIYTNAWQPCRQTGKERERLQHRERGTKKTGSG